MSLADVILIIIIIGLVWLSINYLRKNKNSCAGCSSKTCAGCHTNFYEEYKNDQRKRIVLNK